MTLSLDGVPIDSFLLLMALVVVVVALLVTRRPKGPY